MSAITVRHVPASTILAGDLEPLLKATKLVQKWIPQYTKHDGTFVAAHHKMVHQADDHDDAKVLSGQGSYSQKAAHKLLTKHDWFNQLPDEHKVPILQQHATDLQAADSAKAQLAVMKVDVLAGKQPKPAAMKLFAALPEAQAALIVADLKEKGADPTLLLSVMNAHPAARANKPAVADVAPPAPEPAAAAPKPLDHGELNIPGKTNNIDAQLDKYKAEQAAEAKAATKVASAEKKSDKAQAKELHAQLGAAIVEKMTPGIAVKQGLTEKVAAKQIAETLDELVKWQPKKFLDIAAKFQAETAKAAAAAAPPEPVAATPAAAPPANEVKVDDWSVYTNTSGGHNKFWAAAVVPLPDGSALYVSRYGAIGSKGQTTTKHCATVLAANAMCSTTIAQKKANGYSHGSVDDHPALAAPVSAPPATVPTGTESADSWEQVGGQLGSNSGFVAIDPHGQKWYVKTPNSEAHAKSEMTAAKLYTLAGVKAAHLKPVTVGGKLSIASKWEDNTSKGSAATLMGAGARDGFAVDAWLANWDAMGVDSTNIQVVGAEASRIDVGGALEFRAQGAPKGAAFGTTVGELATLRNPKMNAQTAAVFGGMSDLDVAKSIEAHVAKVTPEQILEATGGDQALAEKLVKRREYLLGWASTHLPKPVAAPAAADEGPKEGETKEGADGQLVFKDGRWHKVSDLAPAAKSPLEAQDAMDEAVQSAPDKSSALTAATEFLTQHGNTESNYIAAVLALKTKWYPAAGKPQQALWMMGHQTPPELKGAEAAAPAAAVKPLSMPEFANGKTSDKVKPYYEATATKIMNLAEGGDVAALQAMVNPIKGTWAGKTANSKKLIAFHAEAITLAQKAGAAPAPAKPNRVVGAAPTPAPSAADAPEPGAVAAALTAIEEAILPATNTNSVPVNKKLQAMHDLGSAGDLAGLQAMTFGSNTYGKKQAKLAAQLITALGGAMAADMEAAAGGKPKFEQAWPPAAPAPSAPKKVVAAAPTKPAKVKLDPTKLPVNASQIPDPPSITFSSKQHVNEANMKDAKAVHDFALKGNLTALQDYHYDALDKETGKAAGKKPITAHPSKHVQSYWESLVDHLQTIANPAGVLRLDEVVSHGLSGIASAFNAAKYGMTTAKADAAKKIAFWIGLGKTSAPSEVMPEPPYATKEFSVSPPGRPKMTDAMRNQSQIDFAAAGPQVRKFVKGIQSSGTYNNNFRDGHESVGGENFVEMNLKAHEFAQEKPPGFEIYKWMSLSDTLIKQVLAMEPGTVFQNPGSMCTSYEPTATSGFGSHRMRIRYAPGAKAVDSFGSGSYAGEKEITTLPGARFSVVSAKMVDAGGGGKRLELDVLMLPPDPTYVADLKSRVAKMKASK